MVETFNGIAFKDLGIVIQMMNGILNLPPRKGDTYYDWGNSYEPLVTTDDIYFGVRRIEMDAFYDERKHSDFRAAIEQLEDVTGEADLVTEYGTHSVKLDQVKVVRSFKGGKTLKLIFLELNPDLSGGLPTLSEGDASVRIDGYDIFARFGLLVEKVNLFGAEKLKQSIETRHKKNLISVFREPETLEVKINGIYASKSDMTSKVNEFNKLLAKEGLRHFIYRDYGFQCFCDEGVKVIIYRTRVQFKLKFKVMAYYNYEEIVQEVVNRVNVQENPQSDLAVTDSTDPAFIKSKDTFKAADSFKLEGNNAAFFAKESEIKALRDTDLALNLENLTPNI